MKTCLFKLSLIAGGAMLASHTLAQSSSQQGDTATTMALRTPATAAKPPNTPNTTLAANGKTSLPATGTRAVIAAGSVLFLSDGIVDSAAMAQIHPPAPGFVYER
jgi:uncharacterized membrane protein YebE (DUF533 family)